MDKFIFDGNSIICQSQSGKEYRIVKGSCSCPGFGFKRNCRHYHYAHTNGLIDDLQQRIIKQQALVSPFIKNMRQKALIWFLEKNGISPTKEMIIRIEPKIKTTTKPESVIKAAKTLQKG